MEGFEPVLRRGVFVLKIATFKGSGFLGLLEFRRNEGTKRQINKDLFICAVLNKANTAL